MNDDGLISVVRRARARYKRTMAEARAAMTKTLNELKLAQLQALADFEVIRKQAEIDEKAEINEALKKCWDIPPGKRRGSK